MGKTSIIGCALLLGLTSLAAAQNVDISAWYGKNTYFYESTLIDVASFLNSNGTTLGGSSFGVDFWLGNKLQYGIGTAYIPEFASNFSSSFTILFITINTNVQSELDLIPMMFQVRYFPVPRWFIGGGAGVFAYHSVVQGSASAWFVPLVGASATDQNYNIGEEAMTGITIIADRYGALDFILRAYTSWPFAGHFQLDLIPCLALSLGY